MRHRVDGRDDGDQFFAPKYLILVFLPVGSGKDLKADIQISGGNGSLLGGYPHFQRPYGEVWHGAVKLRVDGGEHVEPASGAETNV